MGLLGCSGATATGSVDFLHLLDLPNIQSGCAHTSRHRLAANQPQLIKSIANMKSYATKPFPPASGAGLSQGHSTTLGWDSGLFRRFQNPKDKRDFVTAGGHSALFISALLISRADVLHGWLSGRRGILSLSCTKCGMLGRWMGGSRGPVMRLHVPSLPLPKRGCGCSQSPQTDPQKPSE